MTKPNPSAAHAAGLLLVGALALLFTASCGGDESGGERLSCEPNEGLLAQRTECVLDESCPCGSHCELGLCIALCTENAECDAGQWCDSFGRCREGDDLTLVPAPSGEPVGQLEVSVAQLVVQSTTDIAQFTLRGQGIPVGIVRVDGGERAEVRCSGSDEFAPECYMASLGTAADGPVSVEVRATEEPTDEPISSEVTVFWAGRRARVGLIIDADGLSRSARHGPAVSPGPGNYTGFARPVAFGRVSRAVREDLPPPMRALRVPIDAQVFDNGATDIIAFDDALGTVFPKADPVGVLHEPEAGHFFVDMADQTYITSSAVPIGDVEVIAEFHPNAGDAPAADDLPESEGTALVLRTQSVLRGNAADDWSPFVLWEISLVRTSDLAAGATAPAPSTADARTLALARSETAWTGESGWFAGAASTERVRALVCASVDGAGGVERLCGRHVTPAGTPSAHGDFGCSDPAGTDCAVDSTMAANRAFGVLQQNLLRVEENINQCMEDLDLDPTSTGACVDVERALGAIAEAFDADRDRANGGARENSTASALGLRLLQQWLDTHAFVAREAAQLRGLSAVHPMGASGVSANVQEAIERSQLAWDIFLHPRVGLALSRVDATVLTDPDYRTRLEATYTPTICDPAMRTCTEVQGLGLPVTMLMTLRDQARVHTDLLVAAMERGDGMYDEAPLSDFLRRSVVTLAIARSLVDSALPRGPDWEDEWDTVVAENGRATDALFAAFEGYQEGANPLGIEDDDLPLYRIGDEVGAANRFSALSDYLLGAGIDTRAIGPFMVNRAADVLMDAQAAYQENLERDFAADTAAATASRRLEQTNRRYGEQIISLCGVPGAVSDTVLLQQIDPRTCYVVDECRPRGIDRLPKLSVADVGYALCVATKLRGAIGGNATTGVAAIDAKLDAARGLFANDASPFALTLARVGMSAEVRGAPSTFDVGDLDNLEIDVPDDAPTSVVDNVLTSCGLQRQATRALRPTLDCPGTAQTVMFAGQTVPAPRDPRCTSLPSCTFSDQCPVGYVCSGGGACEPDLTDVVAQRADCYQGAIGEAALGVRGAARDVEIARQELNDLVDAYDVAVTSCNIAQEARGDIAEAERTHTNAMNALLAVKLAADLAATTARTVKEAGGADDAFLSGGRQAVGAIVEGAAVAISDTLQFAMDIAENEHAIFIMAIQDEADHDICMNDARQHFVGLRTAALRIERALLDMAQQRVAFDGLVSEAQGLLVEGRAAVRNEQGRRVPPIAIDYWLDERITRYRDYMTQARRTVYLAVLAVEYEFQLTSDARTRVLSARSPAELTSVIDDLRSFTLTGRVSGGSPTNRLAVLSLRDQLLQLADRSGFPEAWVSASPAERFQQLLASSHYAIYAPDGTYLGQQIPFSLSPVGTLGVGLTQGVEVLTGNSCAERLWSVAIAVEGADPLPGSDSTIVPLSLRHRNSFFSQWCDAPDPMNPFRTASVRPSKNLFRDPYDDESITVATPLPSGGADETRGYTDATVDARLNVSVADLERDGYEDGLSYELAGRGLYGEYALWIPASRAGTPSPLDVSEVDDVLLRIEYVSVTGSR